MTVITDSITSITLPDSLEWVDEFKWSPVSQDIKPTIGGGLVIQESLLVAGRPLTLSGGGDVWVKKSIVDDVVLMLSSPGVEVSVTLPDGRSFLCVADRSKQGGVVATPIWRKNVYLPDDNFSLTLNLLVI